MKTSIKSKLFLFAYGTVLFLIVGIIVLNNTFLERYYLRSRQRSLVEAFSEIITVDLTSDDFNQRSLISKRVTVLTYSWFKELVDPPTSDFITEYEWIYGGQRPHDDHLIEAIIGEYLLQVSGLSAHPVNSIDLKIPIIAGIWCKLNLPKAREAEIRQAHSVSGVNHR
jgi:hypothetical protein